eukprot:TRINITY_DN3094_c0_g1_i3.p1 TRINITY_DN3094_c0_g1~~TRINITY_DN3094_c0_g1_i3.p1  ORF type:complete len:503 (-),score=85.01 TRINITY_DN3094_c0_g1_i3:306-1814(-)
MSQQLTPSALVAAFCPRCPGPTVPHRCGLRALLAQTGKGNSPGFRSSLPRGPPASSTASTSATSGGRRSLNSTHTYMRQPQERGPFLVLPEGVSAPGWIRGRILGKGGENFRYIEDEAKGVQLVLEGAGCTRSAWNSNPSATAGPLRVRLLGRKGANLDVAAILLQQLIQDVRAEHGFDARAASVKPRRRSEVLAAAPVRAVIQERVDATGGEEDVRSDQDFEMLGTVEPPSSWEQRDELQTDPASRLRKVVAGGDIVAERARAWREKVAAEEQGEKASRTSTATNITGTRIEEDLAQDHSEKPACPSSGSKVVTTRACKEEVVAQEQSQRAARANVGKNVTRAWREKFAAQEQSQSAASTSKSEEIRDAWETIEEEEVTAPRAEDRPQVLQEDKESQQLQEENRQLREQLRQCMAKLDELSVQQAYELAKTSKPVEDEATSGSSTDDEELSTSSGASRASFCSLVASASSALAFSAFLARPLARRLHAQTSAWRDSRFPAA